MEWADLTDSELCARLEQRHVHNPYALIRNRDDPRVARIITELLDR